MIIDWFTVVAQLANFAILVWLLKRFLYRPVLEAMAARENHVRESVAAAERQQAEAEEQTRKLREQRAELDQQKEGILDAARDQAAATRDTLIAEAHQEAEQRKAQWQKSLDRDWGSLRSELTRRTQGEALEIARRALQELADSEIEERMVNAFTKRLDNLDGPSIDSGSSLVVRSSFALSDSLQQQLESTLHERFGREPELSFETHPELIAGIELVFDGHKLAWSFDDFLSSLGRSVGQLIEPQTEAR